MDAASCFILGNFLIPASVSEPSQLESRRLLKEGWAHMQILPTTLFIPTGQYQTYLPAEADRQGIAVVRVQESQLLVFIGESRQAFKEDVQGEDPVEDG